MLTENEVYPLLKVYQGGRNALLLRVVYFAGLRVSEVCQLRWRNLTERGHGGQITVFGKNGKTRAILLPADIWAELQSLRRGASPEAPVFPSRSGKHLDRGRVSRILRAAAEQAGITVPVSPHWLRHAHASHALDRGAPIHLVQSTLGHSSVATTSMYLHARPGDSSSRFLALISENHLQRFGFRAMNGMAIEAVKGETPMNTETATSEAKSKPAKKRATVRGQARNVASAKRNGKKEPNHAPKAPRSRGRAKDGKTRSSKSAQILELLKQPDGAKLTELMAATGWQPHSVRGFLSGVVAKKLGFTVQSQKHENGERSYSIAS
jgi:hypothetical protein